MPFLDFKFLIRDSAAIVNKLLPSTYHSFVEMIVTTLRHNHSSSINNNNNNNNNNNRNHTNQAPSTLIQPPLQQPSHHLQSRKMINKLEKIDVDPFTAWWQSSKLLLVSLLHHHVKNTKDKYIKLKDKDGNIGAKPGDQVQIRGDFFSKQFFGWNSTFEHTAINKLWSTLQ